MTEESRELHRNQVTESLRGPTMEFRFCSQGNEGPRKASRGCMRWSDRHLDKYLEGRGEGQASEIEEQLETLNGSPQDW